LINNIFYTPIGRAIRVFWDDMPMWVFGNVILAISLLPSVIALISGQTGLAIVFSIFALLTLAGLAQILVKPLNSGVPQWSDIRKGNYRPAVSAWLALSTIASLFAFPGLAVQSF
jgi:hypothetical protein